MPVIPTDVSKESAERGAAVGSQRVARTFVPGYDTPAAIRMPARPRPQAFERRQLARLIERRRLSS
jgi:hypothetical protein